MTTTTPRVDALKRDADAFFEWPTADRTHVSTASMLLFAAMIARKARTAALEEAAALVAAMTISPTDIILCADTIDEAAARIRALGAK